MFVRETILERWESSEERVRQEGTKTTVVVILNHPKIHKLLDIWRIYNHGNSICRSTAGLCHVVRFHTRCLCWRFHLQFMWQHAHVYEDHPLQMLIWGSKSRRHYACCRTAQFSSVFSSAASTKLMLKTAAFTITV